MDKKRMSTLASMRARLARMLNHREIVASTPLADKEIEGVFAFIEELDHQQPFAARMVERFHRAFSRPVRDRPTKIPEHEKKLRQALIDEEANECYQAMESGNLREIAKELADLIYVTYGTAAQYGIDLDAALQEVHRSNMSKLDANGKPIIREDGKVLKSDRYTPADLSVCGIPA